MNTNFTLVCEIFEGFCEAEILEISHDTQRNCLTLSLCETSNFENKTFLFEKLSFLFVENKYEKPQEATLRLTDFGLMPSGAGFINIVAANTRGLEIVFYLATHFQTFYFDAEKITLNGEIIFEKN